jgi:exodeoxyribonuclease V gamma subunit
MLQILISKFNPGKLFPLWIEHLCMHASGQPSGTENMPGDARLITPDNDICLRTISAESAREYLQQLIRLYQQGQNKPLNFIPKASAAWATSWFDVQDEDKAFAESAKAWHGSYYYPGENEDFYNRIVLRGYDWQPDEGFSEYAKMIFEPMLTNMVPAA